MAALLSISSFALAFWVMKTMSELRGSNEGARQRATMMLGLLVIILLVSASYFGSVASGAMD